MYMDVYGNRNYEKKIVYENYNYQKIYVKVTIVDCKK